MPDLNITSFYKIVIILRYGRGELWTDSLGGVKDYKDFGTVLWPTLKVKMNHRNIGWPEHSIAAVSHYSSPFATLTELLVIYLTYLRNECGSIMIGFVATETSFNEQIAQCISGGILLCVQVSFVQRNTCIHTVSVWDKFLDLLPLDKEKMK